MKEQRFPHTRKPLRRRRLQVAGLWGGSRGELRGHRGEHSNRGAKGKVERFPHRGSLPTSTHQPKRLEDRANQHSTAREACLLTHQDRWGLGAEAPASVGSQEEDWGWLPEHSLQGASKPQLAGRVSGKKSGAAEEPRHFFVPLCFLVHKERGLRVPLKGAPETGTSCGYQHGPQRKA